MKKNGIICFKDVLTGVVAVALSAGIFAGCSPKQSSEGADKEKADEGASQGVKTAELAYCNWAEGIAYTHLAELVLEEQMGYDVEIIMSDVGPAFAAVAKGKTDAFMETWLPDLHEEYYKKYPEGIVDLGPIYEGTECAFAVPEYVDVNKVSELNDEAVVELFDGTLYGFDPGSSMVNDTRETIEAGKLNYKLIATSPPAMLAQVKDAISKKEPIVFTAWKPHWMFARWDIKFLEQNPDSVVFWPKGTINVTARKNLRQDDPVLAEFLENMSLTDAELADLMLKVEESDEDVAVVARKWMNEHPEVVEAWIPEKAK